MEVAPKGKGQNELVKRRKKEKGKRAKQKDEKEKKEKIKLTFLKLLKWNAPKVNKLCVAVSG